MCSSLGGALRKAKGRRAVLRGFCVGIQHVVVVLMMVQVVILIQRLRQSERDAVQDREDVVQPRRAEKRVVQKVVGHALVIRAIQKHEPATQQYEGWHWQPVENEQAGHEEREVQETE
jgi:hypothetical protein